MMLIGLFALLSFQSPAEPITLEQLTLQVVGDTLEVTIMPPASKVTIQAKHLSLQPSKLVTVGEDIEEREWSVASFQLADLPEGEFEVVVNAGSCERRYSVFGPSRVKLR
jgi:hypothetical protein